MPVVRELARISVSASHAATQKNRCPSPSDKFSWRSQRLFESLPRANTHQDFRYQLVCTAQFARDRFDRRVCEWQSVYALTSENTAYMSHKPWIASKQVRPSLFPFTMCPILELLETFSTLMVSEDVGGLETSREDKDM